MQKKTNQPGKLASISRRNTLWVLGAGIAVAACSSDSNSSDGTGGTSGAGGSGGSAGGEAGKAGSAGEAGSGGTSSTTGWGSGGTAGMTDKANYPNPFANAPSSCNLICSTTEGPCTTETTIERVDVSEGYPGIPMRIAMRFVDASCNPISGAWVQIWHTKITGVYSGVTPSGSFCYGDEPEAEQEMYFRGSQTTDSDGVVYFDSCFPGWYSSRAVHVHFEVRVNNSSYVVSQLLWEDELVDDIFTNHADYKEFGIPNVHLDDDNVVGGESDKSPYLYDVQKMSDGAMLVSKTITIQSGGPGCSASGGGGMGGPPGG
ncbi:MAG: hypothetical protein R3B89_04465 [Polyangiaceae bacterium]